MPETMYIPLLVALIAGPVTAWVTWKLAQKKVPEDTAETLTDIAMSLINPLKAEIAELREQAVDRDNTIAEQSREIAKLKEHNLALERWAQLLWTRTVESGHTPPTLDESERLYAKGLHPSNHRRSQ